jgi:hypothetical protein
MQAQCARSVAWGVRLSLVLGPSDSGEAGWCLLQLWTPGGQRLGKTAREWRACSIPSPPVAGRCAVGGLSSNSCVPESASPQRAPLLICMEPGDYPSGGRRELLSPALAVLLCTGPAEQGMPGSLCFLGPGLGPLLLWQKVPGKGQTLLGGGVWERNGHREA